MKFKPSVVISTRKKAGLTQVQLADESGLSEGTIIQMEHGRREPRVNTLARIAETLGKTPNYFFK